MSVWVQAHMRSGGCRKLFSESPVSREEDWVTDVYFCVQFGSQLPAIERRSSHLLSNSLPLHLDCFCCWCSTKHSKQDLCSHSITSINKAHGEHRGGWEDHHATLPSARYQITSLCSSLRTEWIRAYGSILKDGSYLYTLVWALVTMWDMFSLFAEFKAYITWSFRSHFWILWNIFSIKWQ